MIEITTYRLAAGVDDATFVAADAAVQTGFAYQQPGILRRTTARSDDGTWVTITSWGSRERASAAESAAADAPEVAAWLGLVDRPSVQRTLATPL
jgi:hypothetical protein